MAEELELETEELKLLNSKFPTHEDLHNRVREFYKTQGYVLSIDGSKPEKYVVYKCHRAGRYRDPRGIPLSERQKETATCKISCPFKIRGKKTDEGLWVIQIYDLSHNHEPSADIGGHPSFRRLSEKEMENVDHMSQAGIPPRQILSSLRQDNPEIRVIVDTLYNAKAKIRRQRLGGRTMIQTLFEELGKCGFEFDVSTDESGKITHLFFIHPMSRILATNFSNIFVMDCTYKTNKYKMPLLNIIGVSCFNTSFYAGCAFLMHEREDDFLWALRAFKKVIGIENTPSVIMSDRQQAFINAVNVVFPETTHLLCVWHIQKNVLTNCRSDFDTKESFDLFLSFWTNTVVYSTNEEEFQKNWSDFQVFYSVKKKSLDYITNELMPVKEKFVGAWTDKHLHLGNRASSRAEGAHAKLKRYLLVSTGDFQKVKDNICQAVEKEYNKITVQLAEQKVRALHKCRGVPFFKELLSHVSRHALLQLYKQYEKVTLGTMHEQCTGNFEATMGLPCAHKMMRWVHGVLPLHLIHQQWRIDRTLAPIDSTHDEGIESLFDECKAKYQEWPRHKKDAARRLLAELLDREMPCEPEVPRPRSRVQRQRRSRAASSTRRDPSQFEIVEASHMRQSSGHSRALLAIVEPTTNDESNDTTMFNLEDLTEFADWP